ncbi:MAG: 3-isopropylmalate dehydratase [Oscillospiraceae bacterium]|nr:3-isopropylmalate dehydratase [Oscillospiraceae bacterium]
MGTFIENILGGAAGSVVTVEPDYVIINDGVSHAAVDEISSVANPEKVYVIYDHDVPTGRPEAAAILRKNLLFAQKYGCPYVQAKGVGYLYMLHEVVKPGQIVVGGGSHAAVFGANDALGINVSIPELARLAETGRFSTVVPETVFVNLTGKLPEGISAMDAGFAFLQENRNTLQKKALEVYAPSFTQHEKEVFLSVAGSAGAFTASIRNEEAENALSFDLSTVEAMVMLPCEERAEQKNAAFAKKSTVAGTPLQAGQIGGYTGGTVEDLRIAASLLKGKKLALGFRLSICPATAADYIQACEEGLITQFIDYGAQINAAGDHSEIVQGAGAMGANETLLTTGLYTYTGAMGVPSSKIYSASVQSVALASVSKEI